MCLSSFPILFGDVIKNSLFCSNCSNLFWNLFGGPFHSHIPCIDFFCYLVSLEFNSLWKPTANALNLGREKKKCALKAITAVVLNILRQLNHISHLFFFFCWISVLVHAENDCLGEQRCASTVAGGQHLIKWRDHRRETYGVARIVCGKWRKTKIINFTEWISFVPSFFLSFVLLLGKTHWRARREKKWILRSTVSDKYCSQLAND